ncbi:alpha/beta-hydrolase [Acrodontium crateriforme]|uniref:Alpha/beta-hydrolase n=1 Tax=Acrodontium crateriforme TaxID=150365 RepID=A0AAQ3M5V8_9PEZI|nr:alpha/beta-hydrolase [Acrodontium crateriforme]
MRGFLSLTPVTLLLQLSLAVDPLVCLDYATYQGTCQDDGVTSWLGLRYAAPPLGKLRFAAPQPPLPEDGTVIANAHGPACLSTGKTPPSATMNEDCLVMDIFAPSSASSLEGLPVYFFIQGGGFNSNSNTNYDGTGLIKASGMNIVVVTFNYRVGPYGFLASKEILQGGSVNNGLKDQRAALQWVQEYIHHFGGDPRQVTMGGDSAGAQSVTLHLTAYGGRDDGLFARSAAESQSFSSLRSVPESQFMYDNLIQRAGCSQCNDTLSCLRNLTATQLQAVNIQTPFPGAVRSPLYMYGPTLDYDFISDYTYRAYAQGKFIKLPTIYGDDTNEGTIFAPGSTNSLAQSEQFIRDQFPDITDAQLQTWSELYPLDETEIYPGKGRYWRQVAKGYGEMRYNCPGIFISNTYAALSVPNSYSYHWNVIDPPSQASGLGVSHTIEINAIWGSAEGTHGGPDSYKPGGVNAAIVPITQAYWTSFIRCGDPNTYRLPGSPRWDEWCGPLGARMMFQTNNTHMEQVPPDQWGRCQYMSSIGLDLKQ